MVYDLIMESGEYVLILRGSRMKEYAVVNGLNKSKGSWAWTCTYYNFAFGVTKDGVAYIANGSHGWAYDDYIFHPNHEPPYFKNAVIGNAEEVIQDWQKIKGILESKANQEKNLYSFTV